MKTKLKHGDWIVTVPLAGLAVAYVTLVFMPGRRATAELKQQVDSKQETVTQSLGLFATLGTTNRELKQTRAYNSAWQKRAPGRGEISVLHAKIRQLAEAAGTAITRFDPDYTQVHGAICETPLAVGCTGSFAQVFEFLRQLEGLPEEIWINGLTLEKIDSSAEYMSCELDLVIFASNPDNSDYDEHSE